MPNLVTCSIAGFQRKIASIKEVRERLIPNIPRDMAFFAIDELKDHELNFGNPSRLNPVVAEIGRISGNLARSWGVKQLSREEWAIMQTQAIAPYAGDVFVYSQRRFGMTPLDSVRRRTHDFLIAGAKKEWEYAWRSINAGLAYKYNPLYGE